MRRSNHHARRPRRRHAFACALLGLGALLSSPRAAAVQELGLNAHQSTDVGLDVTRDAGLGWVRIDLNWFNAQPAESSPPDFGLFDTIVDQALARGLKVLAVVGYGPEWASTGDALGDGSINDVPAPGTYAAFVTAVAEHFQGRVTHYELWNEPNLDVFFEGTPQQYVEAVLLPGADALHAACADCLVMAPGLATVGGEYDVWMDVVLGAAKDRIDIVSGHDYAGFHEDKLSDSFLNKLEEHRVVDIGGTVVYEGPKSLREVMNAHGVTAPFWLTETGEEAAYGDAGAEEEQLVYYRHVLETMLTRQWWTTTIFYESFDTKDSGYEWGVALADESAAGGYRAKAVMALLAKVASSQPAFGGSGTDCDDGLDNEGDELVDYPDDPDCASPTSTSEGEPPAVGGAGGAGGTDELGGSAAPPAGNGSCGCRVAPGAPSRAALLAVAGLLVALARRRRATNR